MAQLLGRTVAAVVAPGAGWQAREGSSGEITWQWQGAQPPSALELPAGEQTLAAALNHSAFNAANALGAWLGGVGIAAGLGWTSTGWVGVLLGLGGVGMFVWALVSERNTRRVAA